MKTGKVITAVAVTALAVATTQAATVDKWSGGSNGNWTNVANWSQGAAPEAYPLDGIARFDGSRKS